MKISYMIFVVVGVFSSTMGSTVKPSVELSLEETVRHLSAKMEEMEMQSRNWRNDLSEKLQELQQWALEQRYYVLKRVNEMEMRSVQTMTNVEEKIQNTEEMLKVTVEKVRSVEEQVESERLKTHSLQIQMTGLQSDLPSVDIIRRNLSSMADILSLQLNEGLSDLRNNMRTFENSTLEFLKDCSNSSYISKLDEKNLKKLEENAKNEFSTLQSGLSLRLEKLEGRCVHCDDVLEMKEILTNHSSLLGILSQHLWEVENTCAGEPPSVLNGKPLKFDRKPKSIVQYECDMDFVLTGNSTVLCVNGRWEGYPPICSFFDRSFTLVVDMSSYSGITCYSDRYSQNIEFSRLVDTGTGEGLPITSRQEGTVLSFPVHRDTAGAFECRFHVNNRTARTFFPVHLYGSMFFPRPFQAANSGENVQLVVSIDSYVRKSKLRWRHNGVLVPAWDGRTEGKISGVQSADAGVYECYEEDERNSRQALSRLTVRKCQKNRYGGNCEQECPVCYNGGVCHDVLGVCICPIGFTGSNCELSCRENHASPDCAKFCLRDDCKSKIFCKPDPYGCSCFPGFRENSCHMRCNPGWYGVSCEQPCHCKDSDACDIYTGACSRGCAPGWRGQSCQIEVVN